MRFSFATVAFGEVCVIKNAILSTAGKPGDRWVCLRKKAGREESPDTVVFALYVRGESRGVRTLDQRATRLVTPGGRFFAHVSRTSLERGEVSATDSATENKPPVQCASVAV